jgi:hypothetical protein
MNFIGRLLLPYGSALLLLHDPDTVPSFTGRVGLIVAAAIVEDVGGPILRGPFERLAETAEPALPVAMLVAVEPLASN